MHINFVKPSTIIAVHREGADIGAILQCELPLSNSTIELDELLSFPLEVREQHLYVTIRFSAGKKDIDKLQHFFDTIRALNGIHDACTGEFSVSVIVDEEESIVLTQCFDLLGRWVYDAQCNRLIGVTTRDDDRLSRSNDIVIYNLDQRRREIVLDAVSLRKGYRAASSAQYVRHDLVVTTNLAIWRHLLATEWWARNLAQVFLFLEDKIDKSVADLI